VRLVINPSRLQSRGWGVGFYHCLSVCLFFSDDISKTDASRITELDVQIFHDESWKRIDFGVKRSKVKVTTSVSVYREHAILPLAAYVSHAGFSPALVFALL